MADRTQDKTSSVSFRLTKSTVKRRGGAPLLETENEKKEYLLSVEDKELNRYMYIYIIICVIICTVLLVQFLSQLHVNTLFH